MRPELLRLKNSKGIFSGMGLTEYVLDLCNLPLGLIAIAGPNGKGKTTVLDNLGHFYRIMPYRAGSYKINSFSYYNEFFGNDACVERINVFNGIRYRSLINIDAERKKQECYLFVDDNGQWAPYGHTEGGKTEAYDKAVESLMGSPRLFFTSNFRCQDATRLSDYSKGDVKDLFVEMLTIDELKEKGQKAKALKDAILQDLSRLQADQSKLLVDIGTEPAKIAVKDDLEHKIAKKTAEILVACEELAKIQVEIQAIEVSIGLQKEAEKNREKIQSDLSVKESRLKDAEALKTTKRAFYNDKHRTTAVKITESQELIKNLPFLRDQVKKEVSTLEAIEVSKSEIQTCDSQYVQYVASLEEFSKVEREIATKEGQVQTFQLTRAHAIETAEKDLSAVESLVSRLNGEQSDRKKRRSSMEESLSTKKALYSDKQRVISEKEAGCNDLLKKEPFLKEQAAKEVIAIALTETLKASILEYDRNFLECSNLIEGFSAMERQVAEKEQELQALQMTRKHDIETAERNLSVAETSAKRLDRSTCGVLKDVCEFAQAAVENRESLPGLRSILEKASIPVVREAGLWEDISSLKKSLSQKVGVELKSKEALDRKAKASGDLAQVEADLTGIRESLKPLAEVEGAKKALVELEAERQSLIKEEEAAAEALRKDLQQLEREIARIGVQIDYLKTGVTPDGGDCPIEPAVKAIPVLQGIVEEARKISLQEEALQSEIDALKVQALGKSDFEKSSREVLNLKKTANDELQRLEKELGTIRESLKRLPEAESAEKTLPELQKELVDVKAEALKVLGAIDVELKQVEGDISALKGSLELLNPKVDFEGEKVRFATSVETLNKGIETMRKDETLLRQSVGAVLEALLQIAEKRAILASMEKDIVSTNREISEWAILEKAFSNDGIIALEIDDAGPTIAGIANDLLYSCFGSRFSVRIDTQTVKADGNGLKETFDVVVYDNERDESKSLRVMSGGERTWIEQAITNAICLFNAARSGRMFSTIYTDERDGALDVERKKEFFSLKRKVLAIGGYEREFFISQSPDIQAMADAVIKVGAKVAAA